MRADRSVTITENSSENSSPNDEDISAVMNSTVRDPLKYVGCHASTSSTWADWNSGFIMLGG